MSNNLDSLHEFNKTKKLNKIIETNGKRVSLDMIRDIHCVNEWNFIRNREDNKIRNTREMKCMTCNSNLQNIFYYVNKFEHDGFICCGTNNVPCDDYIIKLHSIVQYDEYSD